MMHAFLAQSTAAAGREEIYLVVSIGLLGLAVALLLLELFIPSAGVLSILTGVSAVASVASMFAFDVTWGGIYLAALCAGSPVVLILVFKVWSKTPIAKRMILTEDADGKRHRADDGEEGHMNPSVASTGSAASATARQLAKLVGRKGTATTTLRPVGFIRIDESRIECVAESGFIRQGASVVVIDTLDGQLRVREEQGAHSEGSEGSR
ncbi:MAG: hypothetical protein EXS15_03520 [Phycisphaerales bacterium]|nr:hypothetical protein [Phycisphaerales bacterium]